MPCSILNLADCVISNFTDFVLMIVNAPIDFLLTTIHTLLTTKPAIELFYSLWLVIVGVISAFYGLAVLFAGFNLITAGYSAERRAIAKEWLQNVLLMIIAVNASYLLYTAIAEVATGFSAGLLSMIPQEFFRITMDSAVNVSLELVMGATYLIMLVLTVLALALTYFLNTIGILFFPIGLFLYFILPLRDLGKAIISKLLFLQFLPALASIILLGASKLINVPPYADMKILLATSAFTAINLLLLILAVIAIFRAIMGALHSDIGRVFLLIKGHVAPPKQLPQPPQKGFTPYRRFS